MCNVITSWLVLAGIRLIVLCVGNFIASIQVTLLVFESLHSVQNWKMFFCVECLERNLTDSWSLTHLRQRFYTLFVVAVKFPQFVSITSSINKCYLYSYQGNFNKTCYNWFIMPMWRRLEVKVISLFTSELCDMVSSQRKFSETCVIISVLCTSVWMLYSGRLHTDGVASSLTRFVYTNYASAIFSS